MDSIADNRLNALLDSMPGYEAALLILASKTNSTNSSNSCKLFQRYGSTLAWLLRTCLPACLHAYTNRLARTVCMIFKTIVN